MGNPAGGRGQGAGGGQGAPFTIPGESGAQLFSFEDFGSLNTKANRPSIDDKEFAWNENWLPIGAGNLRTLWAEGADLYTATRTIIYDYPFNFGDNNYIANFYSDGTADMVVNNTTYAVTSRRQRGRIGTPTGTPGTAIPISSVPGTFYQAGVSSDLPQCVQWQSKYLIIVSSNTNNAAGGYYIWDGTNLFQAGGVAPETTVTASGSGYTSPPTVSAFGGSGSGATFGAEIDGPTGTVTKVNVTNPGTGYKATDMVQLQFSGGGSDTSAVAGPAVLSTTNGVSGITVINGGTGLTTSSTITLTGGGGTGAQAVITGLANGTVTQISMVNVGNGYTSPPTVGETGAGSGLVAVATLNGGQIASIPVINGGSGYTTPPTVTIDAPTGNSLPLLNATAHATISGGQVTGIVIDNPGLGYMPGVPINVKLEGGNRAASGTVDLMPFGQYGNAVETYQNSVWVANGNKVTFSGPGTTGQFASSRGGGSFIASDNFLRNKIVALRQATGFLYLLADSSINVVSNLQTSVTNNVANTTYNNSNIDPQIGCAWRDTVATFGRALMFANPSGVYAMYGGAAQKVSQQLDTLFTNADFSFTPTACITILYGIPVYLFNFRTIDPYQNKTRTIMAGWDGQKWFMASQLKEIDFLSTQEIDSELTAWGTNGTDLFPLFQQPSTSLTKTFQTKLRTAPTHMVSKQTNAVYVTADINSGSDSYLNVSLDDEYSNGPFVTVNLENNINFVGTAPITFTGSGGQAIEWEAAGLITQWYAPMRYKLSNYGRYLGFTAQTTSEDLTVLLLSVLYNEYSPVAP